MVARICGKHLTLGDLQPTAVLPPADDVIGHHDEFSRSPWNREEKAMDLNGAFRALIGPFPARRKEVFSIDISWLDRRQRALRRVELQVGAPRSTGAQKATNTTRLLLSL